MAYEFSVHLKYKDNSYNHALTTAKTPMEAVIKVLNQFYDSETYKSSSQWVEHIEVHWLHIKI